MLKILNALDSAKELIGKIGDNPLNKEASQCCIDNAVYILTTDDCDKYE